MSSPTRMKIRRYPNSNVVYGEFLDEQRKPTKSGGLIGEALEAAQRKMCITRWESGSLSISIGDDKFSFVIREKDLINGIAKLPKND